MWFHCYYSEFKYLCCLVKDVNIDNADLNDPGLIDIRIPDFICSPRSINNPYLEKYNIF